MRAILAVFGRKFVHKPGAKIGRHLGQASLVPSASTSSSGTSVLTANDRVIYPDRVIDALYIKSYVRIAMKNPSTAPIAHVIDGARITHYGYVGDSSPDSASMAGKGDRGNKLEPRVSVALSGGNK
jgi:hypothetical protein